MKMRRLLLLRHAKSSWDDSSLHDFQRPLSTRGREAAPRIAQFMHHHGYDPDYILCSASLRTRQTLGPLLSKFDQDMHIDIRRDLYECSFQRYWAIIQDIPSSAITPLIIGHNPATAAIAATLIGSGSQQAIAHMDHKFPTAALAVIDCATNTWRDLEKGIGHLVDFVTPRQLDENGKRIDIP